jgi:hypothetical protein
MPPAPAVDIACESHHQCTITSKSEREREREGDQDSDSFLSFSFSLSLSLSVVRFALRTLEKQVVRVVAARNPSATRKRVFLLSTYEAQQLLGLPPPFPTVLQWALLKSEGRMQAVRWHMRCGKAIVISVAKRDETTDSRTAQLVCFILIPSPPPLVYRHGSRVQK